MQVPSNMAAAVIAGMAGKQTRGVFRRPTEDTAVGEHKEEFIAAAQAKRDRKNARRLGQR